MTTVAVVTDPPRSTDALDALVADGPLTASEAAELYATMLRDALVTAEAAGGDVLVNYRAPAGATDAEAAVRAVAADILEDPATARYEVQVGSTESARIGNTVTHLLREEGADSVGVIRPTAPLLARTDVDGASMKLRSAGVVLGPAPGGRVHYAAFAEPIDFADAFAPPALPTLADRAADADVAVDFVGMAPVVERPADLATLVATVRARRRAGRRVPDHTAAAVAALDLGLAADETGVRVVRGDGTETA